MIESRVKRKVFTQQLWARKVDIISPFSLLTLLPVTDFQDSSIHWTFCQLLLLEIRFTETARKSICKTEEHARRHRELVTRKTSIHPLSQCYPISDGKSSAFAMIIWSFKIKQIMLLYTTRVISVAPVSICISLSVKWTSCTSLFLSIHKVNVVS